MTSIEQLHEWCETGNLVPWCPWCENTNPPENGTGRICEKHRAEMWERLAERKRAKLAGGALVVLVSGVFVSDFGRLGHLFV